jgi:molecular chaperone DnaK
VPQIEVTFNIDVNGILNVSAKDRGTSKEISHRIEKTGGLSKEEIEKMKRDAEMHQAEDKKRRETIDLKNQGDNLVFQTERQLKEHGDKVSPNVRGEIEGALNNLKDALKSEDGERIKKTIENLQQVVYKMGEEIYRGAAPGSPGAPGAGPGPGSDRATAGAGAPGANANGDKKKDEDVIDAEYEVKE